MGMWFVLAALLVALHSGYIVAAPTRAHCRCVVVDDVAASLSATPVPTPALLHWKPADLSPSAAASLVPISSSNSIPIPIPYALAHALTASQCSTLAAQVQHGTTIANASANHHDPQNRVHDSDAREHSPARAALAQPQHRAETIVCYAEEAEHVSLAAIQSSFLGLWVVVGLCVFACVAEGVHVGGRWWYVDDFTYSVSLSFQDCVRVERKI